MIRVSRVAPVSRRGVAIYLAAALAAMVAIAVFTYHSFMRGQTQQARLMLQGETAYYLAQAGVIAAIAQFMNTKSPGPLHTALTTLPAAQANTSASQTLMGDDHPALRAMLRDAGADSWVRVEMSLAGFKPVFASSASESGIVPDAIEKSGWLKLHSTAGSGTAQRRLVAFKNVRVITPLPYVLGKFTLFELEPETAGSYASNRFRYQKVTLEEGKPLEANPLLPVSLFNGTADSLEERGWLFLGGGVRKLNLAWGRQSDGDEFQLLEKAWKVTADPAAPKALPVETQLVIMEKGLFSGVHGDNDLFDRYDFGQPADDPAIDDPSLLHLYGSSEAPSATYVLGEVYRRFLSLRYLMRVADEKYVALPWAAAADWSGPPPSPFVSAPAWNVRHDSFEDDYTLYAYSMSHVAEEPYNRSADMMLQPQVEIDPPRMLLGPGRVKHRFGVADFLYRPSLNNGELMIRSAAGQKLFDGNLHGLLSRDLALEARATCELPAASFDAFLALPQPRLPGIVRFTGGDVVIDRPLRVRDGGVIAVDGKLTIAAPVAAAPGARPLVLASLTGDVVVETAEPLEAMLVALNGKIRGTGVGLRLTGGLAAGTVEWSSLLSGSRRSSVTWDRRLDPTEAPASVYGVYLTPGGDTFLQGGVN